MVFVLHKMILRNQAIFIKRKTTKQQLRTGILVIRNKILSSKLEWEITKLQVSYTKYVQKVKSVGSSFPKGGISAIFTELNMTCTYIR